MSERDGSAGWWARGLVFENCNCRLVCPGHVHFDQLCTFERCVGYWTMEFREGEFDGVSLAGQRTVIAYDTPQRMIEGNWTQLLIIDPQASTDQRECLEAILNGTAGGPWSVLGRFVSKRLETAYRPIRIEDQGTVKQVSIDGMLTSKIEAIPSPCIHSKLRMSTTRLW